MNIVTQIARLVVSITFIFSGFVKLIDPLGSVYKFEEYFGADVLNLEFISPYALQFSILLIFAEIMLGVMLLVGFKPGLTNWSLFFLTLVFLFLTWYSAFYNKVTDCGCFGDAIKLSPWETFYKNIVLILLVIILLLKVDQIQILFSKSFAKIILIVSLGSFTYITFYVLKHLPIIDFRPYAIGKNIQEGMIIPEGAQEPVFEDTWVYHVDGEDRVFSTEEKPWNIEGATFVNRKTKTIEEGYIAPIHDFTMERNGEDITDKLMQKEHLMLVVAYNLNKTDKNAWTNIKEVSERALQNGYLVYCFSASTEEDFLKEKEKYQLDFDLLFCDETTLKTIIRSNPGIVILNKGTIMGKWSWVDTNKIKF